MTPSKILVFAGSIRSGALSGRLAAVAAKELALADAEVTHISLTDYPLPLYNFDLETDKGVPHNANRLARLLAAHDGAFIATPEHNRSLPALLKNTLDWISRVKPSATVSYRHKVFAIGGTSDGRFGGTRAVVDLRKVLAAALGGIVIPEQIELPLAQHAFRESGELVDEASARALKRLAESLVDFARRVAD